MGKSQASKRVLELSDSESDEKVAIKSKCKQRKSVQNILKNWNELTILSMNLNVSMVQHTMLFSIGFEHRLLMLPAMTAWRNHPKGLSLNLKDGREILELVHPLHHRQ